MGKLITQTLLTFKRYGESDTDDDGYEIPASTIDVEAKGSLQPLRSGEMQRVSASGVDTYSAYKYYTSTKLQTTDEDARTQADTTTIDGKDYEVFDSGDWSKTVLTTVAHYKVILVKVRKRRGN